MYHSLLRSNASLGLDRVRGQTPASWDGARPPANGGHVEPFVRSRIRRLWHGAASVAAALGAALLVAALAAWFNLDLLRDVFVQQFRLTAELVRVRLGG